MTDLSQISFEGKHADEKILHFAHPHKVQTIWEVSRMVIACIIIEFIVFLIWKTGIITGAFFVIVLLFVFVLSTLSIGFKIYRARRNYLYVTSKRIIFHGIQGLFKDHVHKITLDNIRNVDFQTESLLGKIFGFGTLLVQTANNTGGENKIWHINNAKMLTHYIDKIISLNQDERNNLQAFDASYFKKWKGE